MNYSVKGVKEMESLQEINNMVEISVKQYDKMIALLQESSEMLEEVSLLNGVPQETHWLSNDIDEFLEGL